MMFFNTKQIVFQRVSSSAYLEVDAETTLSYYIIDAGVEINLASVEYKLDKLSGRSTTQLIDWTALDISGVTDDIYDFPITVTGSVPTDNLTIISTV